MAEPRVLFIGGSGVISSASSRLAVDWGIDLYVLNRGVSQDRPLPPGATVLRADVRDPAAVRVVVAEAAVQHVQVDAPLHRQPG